MYAIVLKESRERPDTPRVSPVLKCEVTVFDEETTIRHVTSRYLQIYSLIR